MKLWTDKICTKRHMIQLIIIQICYVEYNMEGNKKNHKDFWQDKWTKYKWKTFHYSVKKIKHYKIDKFNTTETKKYNKLKIRYNVKKSNNNVEQ